MSTKKLQIITGLVGKSTDGGGEIFGDYENNKALGLYSEASGELSYAGVKGYYFHWEDGDALNVITLDDVSETFWEVHSSDNESFIFFVKKDENEVRAAIAQKIIGISGNKITVESLPFTEDERTNFVAQSWICWNHQNPEVGNVIIEAQASHAEGTETAALNYAVHTEGRRTIARGYYSHVEGSYSQAQGNYSHAEGYNTKAIGGKSHAEGQSTKALGEYAHAEGLNSIAQGSRSHAEGESTQAIGACSHTEGSVTRALSSYSHAEGYNTLSGSEEYRKDADGNYLDINGSVTTDSKKYVTKGIFSHAEGHSTKALGVATHAEGEMSEASGDFSHAEGSHTKASGDYSHSEGYYSTASGKYSHVEGNMSVASGENTHAEGYKTAASGKSSHAEGNETKATGTASHAEGTYSTATGLSSHAEGQNSHAKAYGAHAEGIGTQATRDGTHSEGQSTSAEAYNSHAEGLGTIASGNTQHVQGKYNIKDTSHKYAHIVGNGTAKDNCSNAHTIDWYGNAWFSGNVKVGGTGQDSANAKTLATQEYVDTEVSKITAESIGAATKEYVDEKVGQSSGGSSEPVEEILQNELGDTKEIFSVQFNLDYDDTDTGIKYYQLYFDGIYGTNAELMGKTIVVQTYADINMEYSFGGTDNESMYYQLNPNAGDLTTDPESGICNIEIQLPSDGWGTLDWWITIPCLNNPYVTFNAYIKKDSVWKEIKKLEENVVIASGELDGNRWRKWGDGFAEMWVTYYYNTDEFYTPETGALELNLPLPINIIIDKTSSVIGNGTCKLVNQETDIDTPIHLDSAWSWGGSDWCSYWSAPEEDIESVSISLYITGYWK